MAATFPISSSLIPNSTACRHLAMMSLLVRSNTNEESTNESPVPWLPVSWNRSSRRQLDRQDRIPLPGLRQSFDNCEPASKLDAACARVQFPRHGPHRSRRAQLQARSAGRGLRRAEGLEGANALQGTDAPSTDLGRALSRRQCRLRLGEVKHRHHVQRCYDWGTATRDHHLSYT